MKRILLVDGMALLFRGFYATAYRGNFMINSTGTPTNGVYQFLRYFIDGINTFQPTHLFCCWDMGKTTFRTEIYPDYKANRAKPPEELVPQFALTKEVVASFNIPNLGLKNYEADDIIGSLVNEYRNEELIVQTGDLDLLQLVRPKVEIAIMRKGIGNYERFNNDNFYEKRGIHPEQLLDYKGLTGDSADNYPGIKGIGEKTALTLLNKYHSFATILDNVDELTPGLRKRITEQEEMFYLSRKLAEIKRDIPIDVTLDDALLDLNTDNMEKQLAHFDVRFPIEQYF